MQVIGVLDEKYGERVGACIKLKVEYYIEESDMRKYFKGRLSFYKVPEYIRFVDDYPMTASGNIQKYKLREWVVGTKRKSSGSQKLVLNRFTQKA